MKPDKLKVVWICHFSNEEISERLTLSKKVDEFAPWIPSTLKGFEKRDDIEMHIIAPNYYLKKKNHLCLRNINYYFIPVGIPFWHKPFPPRLPVDVLVNFYSFRKETKKIINKINPDIINLIGAENSYYSSAILDYKKSYPVIITIQGFISQFMIKKLSIRTRHRAFIEKKILKDFKYFFGEKDSKTYISEFNKDFFFYTGFFPVDEDLISEIPEEEKKYDCIFFGRLDKAKGIEDFIRIIAEIKKIKSDITGCILGYGDSELFKELAKSLGCENNIEFVGFVKSQKELFKYVKKSKVFLVPPYFERLSSTIREAMFLKVPIVAYATGGIPYINETSENIFLVKTGDYKDMANKAVLLLNNEKLRNYLAEKANQFAQNEFSLKVNTERMMNVYHSTINNYKQN
jgi:glycosyltransferase involved in cell wall biosynthesis